MKPYLLLIPLLWVACTTPNMYEYTVKNQSNYDLMFYSYDSSNPQKEPLEFHIRARDTHSVSIQDLAGPDFNFKTFFSPKKGPYDRDSLKVVFLPNRALHFKAECSSGPLNPLNYCLYDSATETFVFTNSDFERAEVVEIEDN